MADITACIGEGCKLKDKCYRYTCKKNEYRQSYFAEVPIKGDDCEYFTTNK